MGGFFLYTILDKQALNDAVKLMVIEAPHVARKASAGQFVIVRIDDFGERVPLTIADFDRNAGTVTIIFRKLENPQSISALNPGDKLATFAGPLGHPTEIKKIRRCHLCGRGVGIAPVYPMCKSA